MTRPERRRSSICSTRTTSCWSARRTAPITGRSASATISSGSALPGRSFRSIRTAAKSGARPATRSSTRCRSRPIISRSSRRRKPRCRSCATAPRRARAAPPSMPRASAKAATRTGRASARSCASAIARTGLAVVGPNCMGVACGVSKFSTVPDESLQELDAEPDRRGGAERRDVRPRSTAPSTISASRPAISPPAAARSAARSPTSSTTSPMQPELRVILCYIEGIPDAAHFLEAARRARAQRQDRRGGEDRRLRSPRAPPRWRTPARWPAARKRSRRWRAAPASCASTRSRTRSRRSSSSPACPCRAGATSRVMTNSGALRSLVTEAAERTGATLATLSRRHRGMRSTPCSSKRTSSNPLDTKRTIPDEAIRGLPRRAGGRARSRHRADRRGPAARRERRAARRQSACRSKASRGAPRRSARPWRCSRRCWSARPSTAARCGRRSRMCR